MNKWRKSIVLYFIINFSFSMRRHFDTSFEIFCIYWLKLLTSIETFYTFLSKLLTSIETFCTFSLKLSLMLSITLIAIFFEIFISNILSFSSSNSLFKFNILLWISLSKLELSLLSLSILILIFLAFSFSRFFSFCVRDI